MNRNPTPTAVRRELAPLPVSDAELAARILAGDAALFELLMRRYNRLLFRLARAILKDDDEARDAVQAAYILAYYNLDQFRGPTGMQSWLARITVNEAAGRRRKRAALPLDDEEWAALPAHENDEPEHATIRTESLCLMQRAIDELPEDFRIVFMMRGVEQLSVAETAAALDLKEATVKTRFHRARLQLQRSLGRYGVPAVQDAFRFDGSRCDEIVANVLAAIRPHRA